MIATDHQLLQRFAEHHEGTAFEALLARHGPMVRGLCRRLLRDSHAAEDAFQATFLVLARRADSIRRPGSLSSWLYGVAYRVAGKLRGAAQRTGLRQASQSVSELPSPGVDPLTRVVLEELRDVLDDALHHLPEKYRAPLVLCCLEGQSPSEAARALNWPRASLVSRLERGKELLRQRLATSGVALSAGLLTAALAEEAQALSQELVAQTARAAALFQLGADLGGPSASVMGLVHGTMRAMFLVKLRYAALALLAIGLACGAGFLGRAALAGRPEAEAVAVQPAPQQAEAEAEKDSDPVPPGVVCRVGTLRFRHGSSVRQLIFSPDGKTIFSGGYGAPIRQWQLPTGKELQTFGGPDGDYVRLALSPDGRLVAGVPWRYIRSGRGWTKEFLAAHVWDAASGKEIGVLGGPKEETFEIAFSPDSKLLAAVGRNGKLVRIWHAATRKELPKVPAQVFSLVFSPDSKSLAVATADRKILLWDVAAGKEIKRLPFFGSGRNALAFTPDGKKLLVAGGKQVSVVDVGEGKEVCTFPAGARVNSLPAFVLAPDGRTALTAGHMAVQVWDVATGKELHRLDHGKEENTSERVMGMAFSPDGKRIATSARSHGIRLREAATGKLLARIDTGLATAETLAFSPDSTVLAADSYSAIRLWDVATAKEILSPPVASPGIFNQALAGRALMVAQGHIDGSISIRDQRTGKLVRRLEGHPNGLHTLALSPDGRTVAASFYRRVARLYDVATGKVRREWDQSMNFQGFSPDSKLLVVENYNQGSRMLFDAATGAEVRRLPQEGSWPVFTPDGRFLAAVRGERVEGTRTTRYAVRLWSLATGNEVANLPAGERSPAISADSAMMATANYAPDFNSCTIVLHELATGKPRWQFQRKLEGPLLPSALALSPDGRLLAAGDERDIWLWDLATGKELEPLRGHRGRIGHLQFSPDGRYLTSTSADTTALVWDVASLRAKLELPRRQLSERESTSCWDDLAAADSTRAYRSLWALVAAPEQSISLLEKMVLPVPRAEPEKVKLLIKDLEDQKLSVRNQAAVELEKLAELAEPALRRILAEKPNLDLRQRIERLLEPLDRLQLNSPERLRTKRAIEVMERLDRPEAKKILVKLGDGAPEAFRTRAARAALARLDVRSAKP